MAGILDWFTSPIDTAEKEYNDSIAQLNSYWSLLKTKASNFTAALANLQKYYNALPASNTSRKASAKKLIDESTGVITTINTAKAKANEIFAKLGITDGNLGVVPVILVAIPLIAAAVYAIKLAIDGVDKMTVKITSYLAGEKAAEQVAAAGGTAAQITEARSKAISDTTKAATEIVAAENKTAGMVQTFFGIDGDKLLIGGVVLAGLYMWSKNKHG